MPPLLVCFLFFFNGPATTAIYTLSLHDALPISCTQAPRRCRHRELLSEAMVEFCGDRKSTRLNSSHVRISYAVFCLKKKTSSQRRRIVLPLASAARSPAR